MKYISLVLVLLVIVSCKNSKSPQKIESSQSINNAVDFLLPISGEIIRKNKKIHVKFANSSNLMYDSIQFYMNNDKITSFYTKQDSFSIDLSNSCVGTVRFAAFFYKEGVNNLNANASIVILPASKPTYYQYKIVNKWTHDVNSYTQGLVFENNELYEGSGLYGNSTLRKVDLQTGKVLQSKPLAETIFGEGITVFDNKIIQLSWREHVAFVYDLNTFQLLNQFNYSTEGWGITYDGSSLIMSDGSSYIYYMDKNSFQMTKQMEVCDYNGPISQLNELEYIEGEIWANVYTTDTIIRINPKTGEVIGKIDMSGLLNAQDRTPETDVLNGIAYEKNSKRLIVTGKKWPWMFQVTLFPTKK